MPSQFHFKLVTPLSLIVPSFPQSWLLFIIFNIQIVYIHLLLNSQFTRTCLLLECDLLMFCLIGGK